MNSPEQAPESRPAKERRVGTFTFGAVLVICGALMLVSMFFPHLDLTLALKLSPLILVCLGVEVLLASRREGKLRYDWVGMVLCFVLVTAPGAWSTARKRSSATESQNERRGPGMCAGTSRPFFLAFRRDSGIMEATTVERKPAHVRFI